MTRTIVSESLDATFAALADPTRRAILARLARGEASVGELAAPFGFSLPTISRHLQVLERARLIAKRKEAAQRRCELRDEPLRQASRWIAGQTRFWESTLDSLAAYAGDEAQAARPTRRRVRRR
jgi:DNA-binding transcriptional ArsR family regulator